jgi:carboxymethylenebutenolidase
MSVANKLASDIVALINPPRLSRRGFMSASPAATAGYTLAPGPVRAEPITTDTAGLAAGDAKVKVADGEMPVYIAKPAKQHQPAGHSDRHGDLRVAPVYQGRRP